MSRDIHDDLRYVRGVLSAHNPVSSESGPSPAPPAWVGRDDRRELALAAPTGRGPSSRRRGPIVVVAGLAAAAVVAVAVAVTSGSGGSPRSVVVASGPGAKAILSAYSTTQQARSANATFSASAGRYSVTGSGTGDLVTGDGQLTVNLPAPIGQLQAIAVGGAYYLQVPKGLRVIDGGKTWAKVDRSLVEQLIGQQLGSASLATTFDPTHALELLKSVSGPVTTVGPETLPGDSTPSTHYRALVDLSKVATAAPAGTAPADLWLDNQGRLRKLTLSLDLSSVHLPSGADTTQLPQGTATATIELTGYGTPVTVSAPPADQVGDLGPLSSLITGIR